MIIVLIIPLSTVCYNNCIVYKAEVFPMYHLSTKRIHKNSKVSPKLYSLLQVTCSPNFQASHTQVECKGSIPPPQSIIDYIKIASYFPNHHQLDKNLMENIVISHKLPTQANSNYITEVQIMLVLMLQQDQFTNVNKTGSMCMETFSLQNHACINFLIIAIAIQYTLVLYYIHQILFEYYNPSPKVGIFNLELRRLIFKTRLQDTAVVFCWIDIDLCISVTVLCQSRPQIH